eukprot:COSAG02_NODE_737_length_17855_cov_18.729049_1_plen_93_part_00
MVDYLKPGQQTLVMSSGNSESDKLYNESAMPAVAEDNDEPAYSCTSNPVLVSTINSPFLKTQNHAQRSATRVSRVGYCEYRRTIVSSTQHVD